MPPHPRDPTAGSSGAASGADPRARTPAGSEESYGLEVVNARLRRELDACREQLAAAVFGPIPGAPDAAVSLAWLSAQLAQSRRQIHVLSEMLATRSDVTIELEAVLLQLRQPAADGTRSEAAVWAGNALKRLRGVQWVEAIAQDIVGGVAALPAGGSPRTAATDGAAGVNHDAGVNRDARGSAGGADRNGSRQVSRPTAAQRSLVTGGAAPRTAARHAALLAGRGTAGMGRAGAGNQ
jgi:hypothetical protein